MENYFSGFGNHFESEALKGVLPIGQNSPQKVADGLFAEQISGTAFTAPRLKNLRSWVYRRHPSVTTPKSTPYEVPHFKSSPIHSDRIPPHPFRWMPLTESESKKDFVDHIHTVVGCGDPKSNMGCGIHLYFANRSMDKKAFVSTDGDFLIVPQIGKHKITTEFGILNLEPKEIAVIPRGIRFKVDLVDQSISGYICENYGAPFELPNLGPIGANGLANSRDFQTPVASFERDSSSYKLINKFLGNLWETTLNDTPFDVVAWHGNYAPYKYNLTKFNTVNTVSFDHPDPSIFTVLTSPTNTPGVANVDFVIFPPRWMVAENTFRPPYYHRNIMSEFMGLIEGVYDAKQGGFVPGGSSLHNRWVPHGPDKKTFEAATETDLKPTYVDKTMAFMFETSQLLEPTPWSMNTDLLDKNYINCWEGL